MSDATEAGGTTRAGAKAAAPPEAAAQGDGVPGPAPHSAANGAAGAAAAAAGDGRTPAETAAVARAGGRPPNRVHMTWDGEHRFDVGRAAGGPTIRIDAKGVTGPGPVDALLGALASCVCTDVVDILAKRRTPVESLTVDVSGTRVDGVPRRLLHVRLDIRLGGAGIERVHAERAIDLAVTKYCSVRDSLDPQLPIEWTLELDEGEA